MEFGVHHVIGASNPFVRTVYPNAMQNYVIIFVSEKGCSLRINDQLVEVAAYSLLLVPRGIQIESNPDETREFITIYFSDIFIVRTDQDLAFLKNFRALHKQEYAFRVLNVPQQYRAYYEFNLKHLELSKENYDQAVYRDLAYNIIKQILLLASIYMEERRSGEVLGHGEEVQLVWEFQKLVASSVKKEKHVTYYADQLNVSSKKLTALTKASLGITPKDVITEELLRRAKKMLVETSLSIKQIAWELGYVDENNFSSFFLKESGMTAKEYRKRWKL